MSLTGADFALLVAMALRLHIPVVLVLGPLVSAIIIVATIVWTFAYIRASCARAQRAGLPVLTDVLPVSTVTGCW